MHIGEYNISHFANLTSSQLRHFNTIANYYAILHAMCDMCMDPSPNTCPLQHFHNLTLRCDLSHRSFSYFCDLILVIPSLFWNLLSVLFLNRFSIYNCHHFAILSHPHYSFLSFLFWFLLISIAFTLIAQFAHCFQSKIPFCIHSLNPKFTFFFSFLVCIHIYLLQTGITHILPNH